MPLASALGLEGSALAIAVVLSSSMESFEKFYIHHDPLFPKT